MAAPLVEITGVAKSYGTTGDGALTPVLDGVSLTVAAGEFVALVGASGSGKTTLLNLAGGLDAPDRGSVRIAGVDLHRLDDDARSAFRLRHIGFVFQFFHLLANLSVRENIALPLLLLGRSPREAGAAAGRAAAEVGLADKLDRQAHQLSGGEMQRAAIARALVHEPSLLLADEPTGNLDSKTGAAILELIRGAALRHGLTVVMATHDAHAAAIADRVVRMVDGQIEADGHGPTAGS
jgi:putative ABC transport system ATP-binding protein